MKLTIKPIEPMDIGNVRKLSKAFGEETFTPYPVIDDEELDKAMLSILMAWENPDFIFLIAYDGKKPVGFFTGYMANHPYGKPCRVGVAQELYVTPNKRDKFVGIRLIRRAVEIAIERGAEALECVGQAGSTDKRWERYGFKMHLTYGHMSLEDMSKKLGDKGQMEKY
jgi:GNAT superfamily N-acetyltransferase